MRIRVSDENWMGTVIWYHFLGVFGAHRFYVGRYVSGFIYLFTLGILGIGFAIDGLMLYTGNFTDAQGALVLPLYKRLLLETINRQQGPVQYQEQPVISNTQVTRSESNPKTDAYYMQKTIAPKTDNVLSSAQWNYDEPSKKKHSVFAILLFFLAIFALGAALVWCFFVESFGVLFLRILLVAALFAASMKATDAAFD